MNRNPRRRPHQHSHHHSHRHRWPFCRASCEESDSGLPECVQEPPDTMPLCEAMPGEVVLLVSIQECPRLRKRLADLGLNIGMCARVICSHGGGPMILAVKDDARMGIGRGIARKITVKIQRSKG